MGNPVHTHGKSPRKSESTVLIGSATDNRIRTKACYSDIWEKSVDVEACRFWNDGRLSFRCEITEDWRRRQRCPKSRLAMTTTLTPFVGQGQVPPANECSFSIVRTLCFARVIAPF